ncbi:trimethylamine corrinoid protein 2 [Candidatus Epulonipiscium viviparus]|uniref:trimethylamine corrinoid protein 2 n=1 Tax=Candidatus Epulonipiscium viviparus TaxID=420336 RepID=UPI00273811B9|nr:trimethylamine corrinoid protein 2 [Candidatus Epulopiscium viviparus]
MRFKEDIDIVRRRIDAFWENELLDRALVSIIAPKKKNLSLNMFDEQEYAKDPSYMKRFWLDPQTIHNRNIKRLENTYLGGDALPSIFLDFGTSGHCNFYGAKPIFFKDTIWFDPVWKNLYEYNLVFDEAAIDRYVAIATEIANLSQGDYFIGMPDNCGTLDALGHLYGSANVLTEMLLNPDAVQKAIDAVNEGWKIGNELFYNATKAINHGSCHSWMHLLANGKMGQMQCDMSVMFSTAMYEKFVYNELQTQIDWFDYPIYHFDGVEQEKHLDILLSFEKLKAIQWTHVAGQPKASRFISILQRIQNAGKRLIVFIDPEEVSTMLENLSAKGLNLIIENVPDPETADTILQYVKNHSKE